jgi:hypothetical protein
MRRFLLTCFSKYTFELPGITTLLTIKLIHSDSLYGENICRNFTITINLRAVGTQYDRSFQ